MENAAPRESRWDWGRVRLWAVAVCFSLLWGALWARAYHLQIIMGPEYAALAKRQHTTKEQVTGVRGHIMDRNGNVLARSVECSSVAANPAKIQDKQQAALALSKALKLPVSRILAQLQEKKQFVWLARKIDYHTAESIKALNIPGVFLETEYERVYPYKHLAGQLLGFVNIDDKGIEGLEKAFEGELSGRSVTRMVERDARGNRLMAAGTGSLVDLRGRNIRLTLDTQVQFFAEEALAENVEKYGARWGGCIVVDVPTGDILAWAQYPFFDPNNTNATPQADRRNRLASDMLEQGSTIKSFLIAAALEEKLVQPSTMINCEKGRWKLRNIVLHDTHPYSILPVEKILHVSSNIGVAKIGLMLGAEKYGGYLARLGFGERTGLPLAGEAKGILRPPGKWSEVDVAAASFGQSFSATVAQMAQAYLCLASGGIKRPLYLVMDQDRECSLGEEATPGFAGERLFSEATMDKVRGMLREVVEEEGGTGKQARIPGLVVGGKTGTAQKADKSGKYGSGRVGSFVGMIPIEEPRYLVCVLLDEPTKVQYGGIIAAPVFRHVALNTMAYHGLLPDSDDPLVQEVARKEAERKQAGNDKGRKNDKKPGGQAAGTARALAETPPVEARAATATVHTPVPRGSSIVPAVTGMGLRNAVEIFATEGIVPVIKGKGGFVVRQTPEAGRPWPDGKRECTLWLEERSS
ncbi:MAG: penicillin-binding transpeptidase domain-containing protein [Desulfovibrionaceae bacterium]|nr:penicillin-binding transpeptidase domain-containing protein [Desulfovibrionaceae bacterium]